MVSLKGKVGNMDEIKKLLKKYSMEEIAVKVGVSANTIYRWREDVSKPHRIFRKKIEHILKQEGIQ